MSLYCPCGNRISEVVAPDPQRADFIRDEDQDALSPKYGRLIDSYIKALLTGRSAKRAWLTEHFGEGYPHDIPESHIVWDIRNNITFEYTRKMYLCESCGRLLVETQRNTYKAYSPDDAEPLSFSGLANEAR